MVDRAGGFEQKSDIRTHGNLQHVVHDERRTKKTMLHLGSTRCFSHYCAGKAGSAVEGGRRELRAQRKDRDVANVENSLRQCGSRLVQKHPNLGTSEAELPLQSWHLMRVEGCRMLIGACQTYDVHIPRLRRTQIHRWLTKHRSKV